MNLHSFDIRVTRYQPVEDWLVENGTGYTWFTNAMVIGEDRSLLVARVSIVEVDFAVRFKLQWSDLIV